ncbi:MAG: OmpA family protein [Verrucomicrobiota bacterium]
MRKFSDVIRQVSKDGPPDVVTRAGRPVLRVPNARLFAPADAALTSDGRALLGQVAQGIAGSLSTFELRVVCYTDTDAEGPADAKKDPADPLTHSASWDLTAARATAIARFLHEQPQVPFLNVVVSGRGDSEPVAPNTGENHARNRRVEISVNPLPVPFHSSQPPPANPAADDAGAAANATRRPLPLPRRRRAGRTGRQGQG